MTKDYNELYIEETKKYDLSWKEKHKETVIKEVAIWQEKVEKLARKNLRLESAGSNAATALA